MSNAMFFPFLFVIPAILIAAIILSAKTVKILREYERAVVSTLGRFKEVKGQGLVLLIPFVQEMVRVDLRIRVIESTDPGRDIPRQRLNEGGRSGLLQRRQSGTGHHSANGRYSATHGRLEAPRRRVLGIRSFSQLLGENLSGAL